MSVFDHEHLARFITSEGWINQGCLKGDAFCPRKDRGGLYKTSVTRHDGKNPEEINSRGDAFVRMPRKTPINLFGWANVIAGAVRTISTIPSLDIEADEGNKRDPRHANIIGWNLEMGQQMIQAEEIARQASLIPFPSRS